MEPQYRPADAIELHDSGFTVMHKSTDEFKNTWRELNFATGKSYTIDGNQILQLAQHFDIDYQHYVTRKRKDEDAQIWLDETSFSIQPQVTVIGDGRQGEHQEYLQIIKELSAWIEAPQLLHMRIVFLYEVGNVGEKLTMEEAVKNITYSGRFTVWWSN